MRECKKRSSPNLYTCSYQNLFQMKKSQILMLVGALLLGSLFFVPMWNITLEAPQYPTPIGMDIWITKIADANPHDLKNINLMNHYVGMKEIPEHIPEFDFFPWVVGVMLLLGVLLAFIGKPNLYLLWFVLMSILGLLGMYDFYLWEYDYGHNLDPHAAIKIPGQGYQPPLFGSKLILNFRALSYPRLGTYLLLLGMSLSVVAFWWGKKEIKEADL